MALTPTQDPSIFIEEQRPGYVRYRRTDGRRWEVIGVCIRLHTCLLGANVDLPDGTVECVESFEHMGRLKDRFGADVFERELDNPVGWQKENESLCCPFEVVELEPADGD